MGGGSKIGAGFLFTCEGEVLLLLRANTKHNCDTWGLPGGNCEDGDVDLHATARRESIEEMGSLPAGMEIAGSIPTFRGKKGQKSYTVFVAKVSPAVKTSWTPTLNSEHSAWRWFPIGEASTRPDLHPTVELAFADLASLSTLGDGGAR